MSYLSELFLDCLGDDFAFSSVESALKICNLEPTQRSASVTITELRDFWDVFASFYSDFINSDIPLVSRARFVAERTGLF